MVQHLARVAARCDCPVIIQVGDFGYFPDHRDGPRFISDVDRACAANNVELWFIDGNHDDHTSLAELEHGHVPVHVAQHVTYLPRGTRAGGRVDVGRIGSVVHEAADTQYVTQLIETRWTRYGKDRVYVKTVDGADVGHVDLVARIVVAKAPDYATELNDCLIRWTSTPEAAMHEDETEAPIPSPPTEPTTEPTAEAQPPEPENIGLRETGQVVRDLAANVAGAAARAKRNEVSAQAPVLNFVARALGVKTDEHAWRVGAKGEEKVANELAKLSPAWRVLHAVEVGQHGSDIDHIVIGPPGVITLNAKRHPRGKAWVGERMVMVNGQKTDYLRNSRFEAQRAARLLSAACGRPVAAVAAVVFVDLDDFTVKQMPADVHVTTRRRLVKWLQSLPVAIDGDAVDDIYSKARLSNTWT